MNFHHRFPRRNSWSAIISAAGVVLFATLAGCSSHPKDPTAGWTPEKLFAEAKSEADAANAAKDAVKPTWDSLNLSPVVQQQWEKLGYDADKAATLINTRFDYTIDPVWLAITVIVIVGYFVFMLKVSDKEYRQVIAEKFD